MRDRDAASFAPPAISAAPMIATAQPLTGALDHTQQRAHGSPARIRVEDGLTLAKRCSRLRAVCGLGVSSAAGVRVLATARDRGPGLDQEIGARPGGVGAALGFLERGA